MSRRLTALEQGGDGVRLAFADGSQVRADIVIGADGVHSRVREVLLGPERPRFTGQVAYRTTFAASRLHAPIAPARTNGGDRTGTWSSTT